MEKPEEFIVTKNNEINKALNLVTNLNANDTNLNTSINKKLRIQPVIDVSFPQNKYCDVVANKGITQAQGTSGLIYTTPVDRDFYLSALTLSMIKDATSTATTFGISVVVGGATLNVVTISGITLTADAKNTSVSFLIPIKIDRNTAINVVSSTAVANQRADAVIIGFTYQNDVTRISEVGN